MRPLSVILFEAFVVGLLVLLMFHIFKALGIKHHWTSHILGGALIHLFFEFSPFGNLNKMWCRATFSWRRNAMGGGDTILGDLLRELTLRDDPRVVRAIKEISEHSTNGGRAAPISSTTCRVVEEICKVKNVTLSQDGFARKARSRNWNGIDIR